MKLKALFSTLAFLLFAGAASAQSDPSTGGSFGTSFNHNVVTGGALSGTANIGQDASMTAPLPTETKPSFWDRVTGRNRSTTQVQAQTAKTGHRRVWFGPQGTNIRSRSWSKNHDNAESNKRPVALKTTASTGSTKSSGWHLFGKK